jgi:hypothetical protein
VRRRGTGDDLSGVGVSDHDLGGLCRGIDTGDERHLDNLAAGADGSFVAPSVGELRLRNRSPTRRGGGGAVPEVPGQLGGGSAIHSAGRPQASS